MFSNDESSESKLSRLDAEWAVYNAIREGVGLSLRNLSLAGHRDSLRLAKRIAPEIFAVTESLLVREVETTEAKEIREIANATGITFEQALENEIQRLRQIIKNNVNLDDSLKTLNRRHERLILLQSETSSKKFYEGKLIERDARIGIGTKQPNYREDEFYDFSLPNKRLMRVRVLHGSKIEDINGADLIYEHHDLSLEKVRIAAIQYKILHDGKWISKTKELMSQLQRLENCFCKQVSCKENTLKAYQSFRFPSCAAFLRPTFKLQTKDSSILSRGYYMPICAVQALWNDKLPIGEDSLKKQVVRQSVFETLFTQNLLGSRWLNYQDLDQSYKMQGILEYSETAVVHMQCYEH